MPQPRDISSLVLFEDNHLLVVNKPAGQLVQGDETGDEPLVETLKQYVKEKYNKPGAVFLGVVHRLDRPVSGVTVFARTSKALERMNALFRNRQTKKTYWAIVAHRPKEDTAHLVHWLLKDEKKNKTTAFRNDQSGGSRSELNYKIIDQQKGYYLLEVNPITGRGHQIRVQLQSIGCPIVGDVKYGYPQANFDQNICLHARQLEFEHPVKKEKMIVKVDPPPSDFWSLFR